MYRIGSDDRVVEVEEAPWPPGGPSVWRIVADEYSTVLIYVVADGYRPEEALPKEALPEGGGRVAVCRFLGAHASYFGSPNDEALDNHPLYDRGLGFYGVFRVESSSWVTQLRELGTKKNAPPLPEHPLTHFIVTMEDQTFECVASEARFEIRSGRPDEVAAKLLVELQSR